MQVEVKEVKLVSIELEKDDILELEGDSGSLSLIVRGADDREPKLWITLHPAHVPMLRQTVKDLEEYDVEEYGNPPDYWELWREA
jgi:hypothetical protein